jgi:hypothetical protein
MSIVDRIKGALGLGPKLRNKPGQMAWVKGVRAGCGADQLNGRAVKTVLFNTETGLWKVEPAQVFIATEDGLFGMSKSPIAKGQPVAVSEISDVLLELWKEDGVTPNEVERLFDAPKPVKERSPV